MRERDPRPGQSPCAMAFAGLRGVVSLAAALSLPVELAAGDPFPSRDLILFLTFCVILVTPVAQGLTLPAGVRGVPPAVGRRGEGAAPPASGEAAPPPHGRGGRPPAAEAGRAE